LEAEYVRAYPQLYRYHWWWRAREEFVIGILREHLARAGQHRILDIGCGGGLFFERLSRFGQVEGVEIDTTMKTGVEEIDSRIHWGPLETLPPDRRYTVVLLLDVLEHLSDPVSTLEYASRLLVPGGIVIATVPAFPMLWTKHDDINHHLTRYTKRSFQRLASSAGLSTARLGYFFHWTFPAKLVLRAWEQLGSRSSAAAKLPTVPSKPVNRALYLLSRFEQSAGLWRYCPFGSSLLFMGARAIPESADATGQ
jgi:SAM-dependent methyltransferase